MKRLKIICLFLMLFVLSPTGQRAGAGTVADYFDRSFRSEAAGNFPAALNSVLQILQVEIDNYIATLRAGWLSYLNKSYPESEKYYTRAVSLAPRAVEPRLGLLLPLMASGKWKAAEDTARQILGIDPGNYLANRKLAYILFSRAKYGEALRRYSRVLDRYPSDIEMMLGMAWTCYRMDKDRQAREYFNRVLKVRKSNASALYGLELLDNVLQ